MKEKDEDAISAEFLYQISLAAHSVNHPDEFFREIHHIVNEFIPARHVCVTLLDPVTESLTFPYMSDKWETSLPAGKQVKEFLQDVLRTGGPAPSVI